jgi:PHD/YefM family antitoxin component YafN of YafNO toxin-antitoxin module
MTATEARKNLYALVDEVSASHVPVQIAGKRSSAVLVSEGTGVPFKKRFI